MIKPIGTRLIVRLQEETREVSGLVMLTNNDPVAKGQVVAVNPRETEFKEGDNVIIKRGVGINTADGLMLDRKDVLAIIG
jgi:co-chaperonin GroES (HSP10)